MTDNSTTWVFPMAGRGLRTTELGEFKPFIDICGRKMVEWLLVSIAPNMGAKDELVFVTTRYFCETFHVEESLRQIVGRLGLPDSVAVICVEETPPGPSASVYAAKEKFSHKRPVIIVNCDQYIDFDRPRLQDRQSGFLPVYCNLSQKSSYVEIDKGKITRILEKENVSNLASAGVYGLASGRALAAALEHQFEHEIMYKNEYYVGPALNYLISRGHTFVPVEVRAKYDLGNPQGIGAFARMLKTIDA